MFIVQFLLIELIYLHRSFFTNTTGPSFSVNQQHKLYTYVKISEHKMAALSEIKLDKIYNNFLQLWNERVEPISPFHVISCKQK
jgi:hypothetical protein